MGRTAVGGSRQQLFTARRVLALDGSEPEGFLVAEGMVTATGTVQELAARSPDAERIDLDGALVVPGFSDAHCHVSQAALARVRVDVSGMRTADELLPALQARAAITPAGQWVVGQGWNDVLGERIDRSVLDHVSDHHPVLVMQHTFHRAVVNSPALAELGYRDADDTPPGGQLGVNTDGHLDGWLVERAWLDPWLPGPRQASIAPPGEEQAQLVALAAVNTELHRVGITSYCDAIVTPVEHVMYQRARDRGQLSPRVAMLLWHSYFDPDTWHGDAAEGDDRLQLIGVKLMLDGALSGGTCLCQQPYPSATGTDNGLQILDDTTFRQKAQQAAAAGAAVAVHANGDRAIGKVLDAFETLPRPKAGLRHRIEHCSIVDDALVQRMVQSGVVPVPFGAFVRLYGAAILGFYGQQRAEWVCAHRSMLDAGLAVAGSSDFPIVPIDPLLALQSMVTRTTMSGVPVGASQRLDVEQALGVYTHGSAAAVGQAQRRGRLAPGQIADFVVLDADLTVVEPDAIADVQVTSTWVGGECVWQR